MLTITSDAGIKKKVPAAPGICTGSALGVGLFHPSPLTTEISHTHPLKNNFKPQP